MSKKPLDRPDDYHGEHRGSDGRFRKGFSGNPRGRTRRPMRAFDDRQMREDNLRAMEEVTTITVGGARRTVPIIQVILKQLLAKAAKGDIRCMFKVLEVREQTTAAQEKELLSLADIYHKLNDRHPDDLTDDEIALKNSIVRRLGDRFNPH